MINRFNIKHDNNNMFLQHIELYEIHVYEKPKCM